jgi:hypothetical protein
MVKPFLKSKILIPIPFAPIKLGIQAMLSTQFPGVPMLAGIGTLVSGSQLAILQSAGVIGQGIIGACLAPIITKGAIIGGVGYTIYYVVKNRPKL